MELALRGILTGLMLAAPIGPVNIEIVRRGLRSGFLSGWLVGAGAITADTLYCLLAVAGVMTLIDRPGVSIVLWGAGAGFLAFLGYSSIRAALTSQHLIDIKQDAGGFARRSYPTGLLIALLNPMGIAYWASIGGAQVASAVEQTDTSGAVAVVVGLILGLVLWVTGLSLLVHGGKRFLSDRLFRWVNLVSGVVLIGFGVWFGMQAVQEVAGWL
ncbi:MAG: LysE family transporter [Sphaerobacter sp.]|nr:LysE family transporter [Sphaerobacter sp.]